MEEITISIDCYQCGNKLEFPFKLSIPLSEYCYCPECQEGVEVCLNGTVLHISRLAEQFS